MEKQKTTTTIKDTVKIFWQHSQKYFLWVLALIILIIFANITDLIRPLLYKQLFDILASDTTHNSNQLLLIITQMFFLGLMGWSFWRATIFIDIYVVARIMSDLLNTCFKSLHSHSHNFFNNNFSGSLVRRVNRYSKSYEDITDQIVWNIGPTIISIAVILFVLWRRSWQLAAVIICWTAVYVIFTYFFVRYKLKYDLTRAETDSDVTGHLSDTVVNHLNLKLFSSLKSEFDTFKSLTHKLFKDRHTTWNLDNYAEAFQEIMMLILEFSIMYVAVEGWKKGVLTIGDFALIQAYLLRIFDNIWGIGRFMRKIYSSFADAQEMTDVLKKPIEVVDDQGAKNLLIHTGNVNFANVNFSYGLNKDILNDFSLSIIHGERVALIGPSGGGKSTIVKLLLRFFDINSGEISIDDQNIAQVKQDSLRSQISFVPQEPILFHRKLKENIGYGRKDASDAEIIKAAKLAHCHEFISKLEKGYDTLVGERGVKLSGGERQRVAIARAILKNSPILILDEATSSLDSESEMLIQDALKNLMKNRTTIVIAHRLSTIMQMDRIVVIENGKVTEEGTHHELLKVEQGTYQKLWQIQAGGFVNHS